MSRMSEKSRFVENAPKNETTDNQPLVRLRLKNILHKNKEKVKVIEQYKKTMTIIQQAFEEMKEKSGINDLEELTKTILKQEEQETSIYHYINKLNKSLEALKKNNESLQESIIQQ
jgi:coiled-coil domain-containing protein 63/114